MSKFKTIKLASVPDWIKNPEEVRSRGFKLRSVAGHPNWVHLVPEKDKYFYLPDEMTERSVIYELPNFIPVSRGLNKFMNYGEQLDESGKLQSWDQKISDAIKQKRGIITKKEDGVLIIRSVFKGVVILRTRGAISVDQGSSDQLITLLGAWRYSVVEKFETAYPKVLDPNFSPDMEMYFEYVGPDNDSVIKYPESDLVFIHAREKESEQMLPWSQLQEIARNSGLNLVSIVEKLNSAAGPKQIKKIITEMEESGEWEDEGVVVRHPDEPLMTKIKGPKYLAMHRMHSKFTYKVLVEICEKKSKESEQFLISKQDFKDAMQENEYDYEIIEQSKKWFDIYIQRKEKISEMIQIIQKIINQWKQEYSNRIRQIGELNNQLVRNFKKEFATSDEVMKMPSLEKSLAMTMFDVQILGSEYSNLERTIEKISENILIPKNDGKTL